MFLTKLIPQKIKNVLLHYPSAVLANIYYGFPSHHLKLIGVTGTDGKTTTSSLIYHLLKESGYKTGLVSTVIAKIDREDIDTGFHVTSPSPWKLQKLLARMVKSKTDYAVLEVTSHGLDQYRFFGCHFEIGIVTNITREHLDYHKDFQDYLKAKIKLLKASSTIIFNNDDKSFSEISKQIIDKTAKVITYSIYSDANLKANDVVVSVSKNRFVLTENGRTLGKIEANLPGEFNVYNELAAIAAARALGLGLTTIDRAINSFAGVIGRTEVIANRKKITIVIDFAHTPNAIDKVLNHFRSHKGKKSRIIAVFGAAGLRDRGKRFEMGQLAAKASDVVILTSEDPRTENMDNIIGEISRGCRKGGMKKLKINKANDAKTGKTEKVYFEIPDRQEAINFAIRKIAQPLDVVVICGKGHERSMCFGNTEFPWSEHKAVEIALRR